MNGGGSCKEDDHMGSSLNDVNPTNERTTLSTNMQPEGIAGQVGIQGELNELQRVVLVPPEGYR